MKNPSLELIRYDVADLAHYETYLGMGSSESETVVTVICGRVSGELDRVVSRDEDGGLVVVYEARVDGLHDGMGVAQIECRINELRCLATVAGFLADEVDMLTARDETATTT